MYQLLCSDLMATFGFGQVLPLLNLYLLNRGFTLSAIATSASLLLGICFVGSLPAGLWADFLGCKSALVLGALLQALGVWGQILAQDATSLYLAALLSGLALALFSSAKVPLLSQIVSSERLAATITLFRGVGGIGGVLGGIAAARICLPGQSTGSALRLGALSISLAIIPLLLLPTAKQHYSFRSLVRPRWRKDIRRLLLGFSLAAIGYSLLTPFANLLLTARGFSASSISLTFSVWQAAAFLAWPMSVFASQKLLTPLPMSLAMLSATTLLLAFPLPASWWWFVWLLWQLLLVLVQSLFQANLGRQSKRAMNFAGLSMLQTGAAILGTVGGRWLLPTHNGLIYWLAAGSCLSAWLILPRTNRKLAQ